MERIIYLDTNIYLDYLFDRVSDISGRRLGDCASKAFSQITSCKYYVAISDWNLKELSHNCEGREATMLFSMLKAKTKKVTTTEDDLSNARKLSPSNWDDALHAVLAKKAGAEAVVTQNIQHFVEFSGLIEPKRPEQL